MSTLSTVFLLIGLGCCDASQAQPGMLTGPQQTIAIHAANYQEPDPSYAKWSRLAFREAGKVYTLLDYKYMGHSHVAAGVDQQQFRFWVRHQGKEFPLIVSIRYNPVTEKLYSIDMEQEKRGNLPIL
ncbi:DUF3889 domain-containing protein [Paenibacillus sp. GCM10023248]|uniref:DUF3889 domain-containing protein n=1 Tax=Bacillales TaxID=1385 RepID=UPI002378B125|nr:MULTISPECIES: DUF3889 domain-containing protein [Bacillales]MDD9269808.1 DUF3889 domain-containing protein [Paenibacillus sp. MAHUQ-63]MDR6881778.1 hypothetical protein [Bacillus sp. 3255]